MIHKAEIAALINGYQGLYDGQYGIDLPYPILKEEFIKDLYGQFSNQATLFLKQTNGLLVSKASDWDTNYFGYPVYKLEHLFSTDRQVASNLLHQYVEELRTRKVKYAFSRVKSDNYLIQNALTANSFDLMIHKVMLRLPLQDFKPTTKGNSAKSVSVRSFERKGEEFVLRLAGQSLNINRFTADNKINQELVAGIYQNWVKNLLNATSDSVFIAECNGQPAGMVAVSSANALYGAEKFPDYPMGFISLVAVEENFRGKSVGHALIQAAAQYFYKKGCKVIFANTALQNTSSLFMFQWAKFQVFSMVSEYRIWLD